MQLGAPLGLTHLYQLNNCAISCLEAPKKDTMVQMCSDEGQVKVSDDLLRFALIPAMTPVSLPVPSSVWGGISLSHRQYFTAILTEFCVILSAQGSLSECQPYSQAH